MFTLTHIINRIKIQAGNEACSIRRAKQPNDGTPTRLAGEDLRPL